VSDGTFSIDSYKYMVNRKGC